MPSPFYNILVPVDFTGKNKWAIAKAVEIANMFQCNIHLVHVLSKNILPFIPVNASRVYSYHSAADMSNARKKLEELRSSYQDHLCEGSIEISLLQGNTGKELQHYVEQYHMDLVVTGLAKFNLIHRIWSSISISSMASQTTVPVLAVRSSGLVSHFKKIVMPLSEDIPLQRIKLATLLGRSFKSTIYLVGLRNNDNTAELLLDKTLEVVQSLSTIPVQCVLLEGKNLAKTTLEFSKRINADLIMANPLKEFHMPGWWNRITGKLLSYASQIPVLTVNKASEDGKLK